MTPTGPQAIYFLLCLTTSTPAVAAIKRKALD